MTWGGGKQGLTTQVASELEPQKFCCLGKGVCVWGGIFQPLLGAHATSSMVRPPPDESPAWTCPSCLQLLEFRCSSGAWPLSPNLLVWPRARGFCHLESGSVIH